MRISIACSPLLSGWNKASATVRTTWFRKLPCKPGGRICQVRGRQAALIHYEFTGNKTSLFILDGRGLDLPEKQLVPLEGKRCLVESGKGYNVVAWKERGLLYGFVSDANSAELLRMAASF